MKARASRKSSALAGPSNSPLSGTELARQWARADVFSAALAGCLCAGGFHIPLDPTTVAQDLLIYLEDKYRNAGEGALADFVARSIGRAGDFDDWLAALDQAALAPQARAQLMADLSTTLTSMSSARGFACT